MDCSLGAADGGEACAVALESLTNPAGHGEDVDSAFLQHTRSPARKPYESTLEKAYHKIGKIADFIHGMHRGRPGVSASGKAVQTSMAEPGLCQINSTSNCSISSFPEGSWTLIDADGEGSPYKHHKHMKCFDGTSFIFKFYKGLSSKLLIFMQGGGACWNAWSAQGLGIPGVYTTQTLCTVNVAEDIFFTEGPLNTLHKGNPYRSHSMLVLPSCSGDGFSGSSMRDFRAEAFSTSAPFAHQMGYHHVRSAVEWLQSNSQFSPDVELDDFTMQGCSSGAIGTQIWANALLGRFKHKTSRVVIDSYAGLFQQDHQVEIMTGWGTCDLDILTPEQRAECKDPNGLFILSVTEDAMRNNPSTRFVSINSKQDVIQRAFHTFTQYRTPADIAAAFVVKGLSATKPMEEQAFYEQLNTQILRRFAEYDNWQGFLVNGAAHCYINDAWDTNSSNYMDGNFYTSTFGNVETYLNSANDQRTAEPATSSTTGNNSTVGAAGTNGTSGGISTSVQDSPSGETEDAVGDSYTISETDMFGLSLAWDLKHIYDSNAPSFLCAGEAADAAEAAGSSTTYCDTSLR